MIDHVKRLFLSEGGWDSSQGLLIAILQAAGSVSTVEDGKNLQNLLICLEMLPAGLGMLAAFPYTEYKGSGQFSIAVSLCCMPEFECLSLSEVSFVRCSIGMSVACVVRLQSKELDSQQSTSEAPCKVCRACLKSFPGWS